MSTGQLLGIAAIILSSGVSALAVIAAVATFKSNPIKKHFDTKDDVFNSHPEEQDK